MNSSARIAVAVAAVTATLLVSIAPASAGTAQAINLLEIDTAQTGVGGYAPPASPLVGQGLISHADLYRWAGSHRGAKVGNLRAYCVFTAVDVKLAKFDTFCAALLTLPAGTIEVLGFPTFGRDTFTVPIVAGSGAYATARGSVRILGIGQTKSALTIILST